MSPRFVVRVITLPGILLLLGQSGFAQATGTAPPKPTTGTSGPPANSTGTVNLPNTPANTNTTGTKNTPVYTPPLYVTGRVALEDGTPPPEPVTIERVCGANSHAEGYSDSHGNFGIEIGNESTVFQDASEEPVRNTLGMGTSSTGSMTGAGSNGAGNNGMGVYTKYQNCELRAKLAGYRSQTVTLANRRPLDDPNIGTILLHKEGGGENGTLVSASTLAAPKDSRKAYERGMQAMKKNKADDAVKEFQKAVDLYPGHAEAWYELGRIQASRGQNDTARDSFNAALKADPKFVNPYVQLSVLTLGTKNWKELSEVTDRGMRLDSFDYPQLFLFNAVANYNMHRFDIAERSIRQAVRLDTQRRFAEIPHLFGLILVLHKDYPAAAEQLRTYLRMSPDAQDAATVRAQIAEMERLTASSEAGTPKDK